jgi:hypothetical protein
MAAPRIPITDLPDQPAVVDTDLVVVQNGPTTKKMAVGVLRTASATALTTHLTDSTDAHLADAIGATPNTSPLTGTTVQTQLGQAAAALNGVLTTVTNLQARLDEALTRIDALENPH